MILDFELFANIRGNSYEYSRIVPFLIGLVAEGLAEGLGRGVPQTSSIYTVLWVGLLSDPMVQWMDTFTAISTPSPGIGNG